MSRAPVIVSGGQTGVDRAALDAALELGLPVDGWCPAGRWAEDGPLPARYPLRETASPDPEERTRLNVRDADAVLVVTTGAESGGTDLALEEARRLGRPVYHLNADAPPDRAGFGRWLRAQRIVRLNVVGPRESESPGIYEAAGPLLLGLLASPGVHH